MNDANQFLIEHGTPILFVVLLLEQAGLPLPALPWLVSAGALAAVGKLNPGTAIALAVMACLIADSAWFFVGRRKGRRVVDWLRRMSLESHSRAWRSEGFLVRHAATGLLGAKFLGWLGMVIPPLAGTTGMSYRRFLVFDGVGSLLYSSSGIFLGILFSQQLIQGMALLKRFGVGASALVLALISGYVAFKVIKSRRSRSEPQITHGLPMTRAATLVLAGAAALLSRCNALSFDSFAGADGQGAPKRQWTASLRWENDCFGGTDRFYTDGVALGISHTGPSWLDPLADCLPWGEGRRTVTYDMAQAMFTPSDTDRPVPDPNDRPYAGILAFGLTLHVDRSNSYNGLKFVTGVVGPWSLAEETQSAVHRAIGNKTSQGWDYQLHNEPIFNLAYEYRHKFRIAGPPEQWSAEALPLAGGWLGNMLTQAEIGGLLRAGYNMPDDFGPSLVRGMGFMPPPRNLAPHGSKSGWGFSVYGGSFANFVLRDITLDGNTFEDSPSVDKKIFVPAAGVGATVGNRRFQVSFSYVFWGKEFDGQPDNEKFGSIAITYLF